MILATSASNNIVTTSAAQELIDTIISCNDRFHGRRKCTQLLNQWKKDILPRFSRSTLVEYCLRADNDDDDDEDGDSVFDDSNITQPSIVKPFSLIINNHRDFPTEGHREASVEILKYIFHRTFVENDDDNDSNEDSDPETVVSEDRLNIALVDVFCHCSRLFHKRMSMHDGSNNSTDSFHHGTMTMYAETSEHIRLSLVELMINLGEYYYLKLQKTGRTIIKDFERQKLVESTSVICQTLAQSTLFDPYPEIPKAACNLLLLLVKICPLAVRMNATSLLIPLTGGVDDNNIVGGSRKSVILLSASARLTRHRHTKTRSLAVEASAAIVMCCPKSGEVEQVNDETPFNHTSGIHDHYLPRCGSYSISMEQVLQTRILPEWEEMLKQDSSTAVKVSILNALGVVTNSLDWSYPSRLNEFSEASSEARSATNAITALVKTRVLTLFLVGMTSGNVAEVRLLASEKLRDLISHLSQGGELQPTLFFVSYFHPMLEHLLNACAHGCTIFSSRVSSLQTLQVLLSISVLLMNEDNIDGPNCSTKCSLSDAKIMSIVNTLSKNILSDEKEIVEAALACCHSLGANNFISNAVVRLLCDHDDLSVSGIDDANSEEMTIHPNNKSNLVQTTRCITSQLLILDGVLKGCKHTKYVVSILREVIDQSLPAPSPNWFHECLISANAIGKYFFRTATTKNISSSFSLAWAMADACDSFVKCTQYFSNVSLTEDIIINILVSIAYLLGCSAEYGISLKAMEMLHLLSSSGGLIGIGLKCEERESSLFDVHFRKVFDKIISAAPQFPWKQSESALPAVDALLRTCMGSTIGSNFDVVAPFFIAHLPAMDHDKNCTNDELADEYSFRISLMALLQTVLSNQCTSYNPSAQQYVTSNDVKSPTSSADFTTGVILSLVLPNLVWRVGGMASALRKLALSTLFALFIGRPAHIHLDMLNCLIPTLLSSFDDTESTIRELSCACFSLILQNISDESFSFVWENNPPAIDSAVPRLLELLDDSHGSVRFAACNCLRDLFPFLQSNITLPMIETTTTRLLIHLDDSDEDLQTNIFLVLSKLVEICLHCNARGGGVQVMKQQINASMQSHRDTSHCLALLESLDKFKSQSKQI